MKLYEEFNLSFYTPDPRPTRRLVVRFHVVKGREALITWLGVLIAVLVAVALVIDAVQLLTTIPIHPPQSVGIA